MTMLLGTMLTKEELDDFMAEADAVCNITSVNTSLFIFLKTFQDGNGKLDYDEFVKILVGPK